VAILGEGVAIQGLNVDGGIGKVAFFGTSTQASTFLILA